MLEERCRKRIMYQGIKDQVGFLKSFENVKQVGTR